MSNINLYTLSNKIRTTLLTTIDKEISINSKNNGLLINSQNQEQLAKKFANSREFLIESNESFEGVQCNEDNSIYFGLSCNYSNNKLTCFYHSSKLNNEYLFYNNLITNSYSPKKNKASSKFKKNKNSETPEKIVSKFKIDSGKTLITETDSSFSFKEAKYLKNSVSLSCDNSKKYVKKISADLYTSSVDNNFDDSSKLINYCYKLKKPKEEIINEISDDDTSTNKKSRNNNLFTFRVKNKHKNAQKKKLKKTINKEMSTNKNSHNDEQHFIARAKKNTTNFTNEKDIYFKSLKKLSPTEKIKFHYTDNKLLDIMPKKTEAFHSKNIFQLNRCNSRSPEKKSKGKKKEQSRKSLFIQVINKKPTHKKSQNLLTYFKSTDDNPIILKQKGKKETKNVSNPANVFVNSRIKRKYYESSRSVNKSNEKYQKNEVFICGKKILKKYINKRDYNIKTKEKI